MRNYVRDFHGRNYVRDFHGKASQATSLGCGRSHRGAPCPKSCGDRRISAVPTFADILPLNLLPGATNRCEMESFGILSYQKKNMKKLHVKDNMRERWFKAPLECFWCPRTRVIVNKGPLHWHNKFRAGVWARNLTSQSVQIKMNL